MGRNSRRNIALIAQLLGGIGRGVAGMKEQQDQREDRKFNREQAVKQDARADQYLKLQGINTEAGLIKTAAALTKAMNGVNVDPKTPGGMYTKMLGILPSLKTSVDDPKALDVIDEALNAKRAEMQALQNPSPGAGKSLLDFLSGAKPEERMKLLKGEIDDLVEARGAVEWTRRRAGGGGMQQQQQGGFGGMPQPAPGSTAVDTANTMNYLQSFASMMGTVRSGQDPGHPMLDALWQQLQSFGNRVPQTTQMRWQGVNPTTGTPK